MALLCTSKPVRAQRSFRNLYSPQKPETTFFFPEILVIYFFIINPWYVKDLHFPNPHTLVYVQMPRGHTFTSTTCKTSFSHFSHFKMFSLNVKRPGCLFWVDDRMTGYGQKKIHILKNHFDIVYVYILIPFLAYSPRFGQEDQNHSNNILYTLLSQTQKTRNWAWLCPKVTQSTPRAHSLAHCIWFI